MIYSHPHQKANRKGWTDGAPKSKRARHEESYAAGADDIKVPVDAADHNEKVATANHQVNASAAAAILELEPTISNRENAFLANEYDYRAENSPQNLSP